jgi:outer membrane protein OmpA-like peptidoglycan-associated protein
MKQSIVRPLITSTLIAIALRACGGAPKKIDSLEQARSAYGKASSDIIVAKHAPVELDAARMALTHAENVWKDDGKRSRVDHYAYVASQRVKIAELIAESKEADIELENMKLERQRVQLDLRADEIERARLETLALQKQMQELQAKNTERGMVLTLGDVLFDTNEATLKSYAGRNMDKIADFMRKYPKRVAMVEGHTDSMGDDDYNMDLSRDRAFAVRTALVKRGVSMSRITTQGFGEAVPVANNATTNGRQENRRVEIIFPDDDSKTRISEFSGY